MTIATRPIECTEGVLPVPESYRDRTTHAFAPAGDAGFRVMVYRNEPEGTFEAFAEMVKTAVRRSKPALRDLSDEEVSLPGVAARARRLGFRHKGSPENEDAYEVRLLFALRDTYFSVNVTSDEGDQERCDAVVASVIRSFKPKETPR